MNKIVIIGYSPLCQKQNVLLGIEEVAEVACVEYWDVSPIVGDQGKLPEISLDRVISKRITHKRSFRGLRKQLDRNVLVVFYMNVRKDTFYFFRQLIKTRCKIATIVAGCQPALDSSETSISHAHRFFEVLKRLTLIKLLQHFENKSIDLYLRFCHPFDYCLCAGNQAMYIGARTAKHVVPINDCDFQIAKGLSFFNLMDKKYILFLDQYEPFHPDNELLGIKPIDSNEYYMQINNFFDIIEERFGLPVVISAHPKAEKYHEHNFYNGRRVFFGETARLSKSAEFVIAHNSTAISYPVIFKKPILFVYTKEMRKRNFPYPMIKKMSHLLNCNCLEVSCITSISINVVDADKYDNYMYSFLTNPSVLQLDNYSIIVNLLQENNDNIY